MFYQERDKVCDLTYSLLQTVLSGAVNAKLITVTTAIRCQEVADDYLAGVYDRPRTLLIFREESELADSVR